MYNEYIRNKREVESKLQSICTRDLAGQGGELCWEEAQGLSQRSKLINRLSKVTQANQRGQVAGEEPQEHLQT